MRFVTAEELQAVAESTPAVLCLLWHLKCFTSGAGRCGAALGAVARVVQARGRMRKVTASADAPEQLTKFVVCALQTDASTSDMQTEEELLTELGLRGDATLERDFECVALSLEEKEKLKRRHASFTRVPHALGHVDGSLVVDEYASSVDELLQRLRSDEP